MSFVRIKYTLSVYFSLKFAVLGVYDLKHDHIVLATGGEGSVGVRGQEIWVSEQNYDLTMWLSPVLTPKCYRITIFGSYCYLYIKDPFLYLY